MKLSKLIYPEEYRSSFSPEAIEITSIASDTRALTEGALFICLRSARFDTHTLLEKAEEAKAAAVIAENGATIPEGLTIPIFRVPSTRAALALAHSRFHGSPEKEMTMIGVTGTNGKTSTAYMLKSILDSAGKSAGLIGTDAYGEYALSVRQWNQETER